jgi:hypothetical protein
MVVASGLLGITYQQLNVILFVILRPAITIWFWWRYRVYKKRFLEAKNAEPGTWNG